ncbi:MAG: SpoIID/LytB domain-containing protein [Acidobacteriota bacterium]|nr:SpoIID/LytB domain-containing protein [Blastocatellia bacterium]MDW8238817.1 SpoIID/LytB domain-containing protein [Acidobacteriota bacterium]
MNVFTDEPTIAVGLLTGVKEVHFELSGEFQTTTRQSLRPGQYQAVEEQGRVRVIGPAGEPAVDAPVVILMPRELSSSSFTLGVTIGIDFHWQRQQRQSFRGTLKLMALHERGLTVINQIPLESYLISVIASEMSALCPLELLKAHAVVSRSWLLAQLQKTEDRSHESRTPNHESRTTNHESRITHHGSRIVDHEPRPTIHELIRWYDRESHADFDVCADDHCQRYQGIGRAFSSTVFDAVEQTRGLVLVHGQDICDTRFSKCCGGMSENYRAAWQDVEVPYLVGVYDGPDWPAGYGLPLTEEANAERWITGAPPAYCHTSDATIIEEILPDFDQETRDFYRWQVCYAQDELQALLRQKLGFDLGSVISLEAIERGVSGRIVRLKIVGDKMSIVVGKELEIRRALSPSHLYSSAFIVRAEEAGRVPERFRLIGAGWGHGVGLCQIGAAVMARQGKSYREILTHYYRGSSWRILY